jgi:hypothetical protein
MGAKRIIWHVGFGWHLRRHGPRAVEVREEVLLSEEALRLDFLLLRKLPGESVDDARTLRKLWPLLPMFTIVEYKSPGRPLRKGDLDKLWAYVHLFVSDPKNEVVRRDDICAVLAVPHRTPTLNDAVRDAKLRWENLGDGYFRVHGGQFVLYVVELDVAGRAEHDDLVYALGSGKITTVESQRFFAELIGSKEARMAIENMEGMTDVQHELLEIVMMLPKEMVFSKFQPEQRLAGLAPEQRLTDLDRDHQALALPLEVLKLLPEEYFASLSKEVQTQLAERLAKP